MVIEDLIFTGGSLVLAAALLPSVFGPHKPALSSSILTGTVLVTFAATYYSMEFWFSFITTAATAVLWYTLAYQKERQEPHEAT
jgi:4-hydroxybenzoate polyprenyltransferase